MKHHDGCTWLANSNALKPAKGDVWANLNYIWCHAFCDWPDHLRDVKTTYEAAHGKAPWWWWRSMYFRHWKQHLPCCFPPGKVAVNVAHSEALIKKMEQELDRN